MKLVKKIFLLLLLALLFIPEFQARFNTIKTKPLNGVFENEARAHFTARSWIKGTFQAQYGKHFDDSLGLKSPLVRLYNQMDLSLFGLVHASKIVRGKEDYLFADQYLHAAAGRDFIGTTALNNRVKDLKKLQDLLWNQHRIFLLVILCPDKPTFYPEYIPDRFRSAQQKMTNSSFLAERCAAEGVHVIDFNPWFLSLKGKTPFPLIPKTGIHWSYYGAYLAADSMAHYLKAKSGFPIPRIILDSISTPGYPIGEDNDIGVTINLINDIPCQKMGYPKFHGESDPGQKKPSALFVGDSFYWNWFNSGMITTLFSNEDFWYYAKDVYPENRKKPTSVSDIDVEDAIKRQNFIILIQVNGAYGNPGFGFTELAMSALDSANSRLVQVERSMRENPKWMKELQKKAEQNHTRIEDQIRADALYMIEQEKKQQHKK